MYLNKKKYSFYKWKDSFITIKRNSKYNYMKIYPITSEKGKVCGTDSLGNKLYFPKNVECPINDIIITQDNSATYEGYSKIVLSNSLFLFYTNKNINGNILVDIKAGPNTVPLQLNYEKSNEICDYLVNASFYKATSGKCGKYFNFSTIPFYKEIDNWNFFGFLKDTFEDNYQSLGKVFLYAFTYQGINFESVKSRGRVRYYKYNMDNFKGLTIFKDILTSFNIFYYIFFSYILLKDMADKQYLFIISVFIVGFLYFHFIILLACFGINIRYVQYFMNKINEDFEYHKSNYGWTLTLILLDIIFIVYYTCITLYLFMFKGNSLFRWDWEDFKQKWSSTFNCFKKGNSSQITRLQENDEDKNKKPESESEEHKPDSKEHEPDSKDTNPEGLKNENNEHVCLFCLTNPPQVILSPCGHRCLCDGCYEQYRAAGKLENCPYCRTKIESVVMKVFSI